MKSKRILFVVLILVITGILVYFIISYDLAGNLPVDGGGRLAGDGYYYQEAYGIRTRCGPTNYENKFFGNGFKICIGLIVICIGGVFIDKILNEQP